MSVFSSSQPLHKTGIWILLCALILNVAPGGFRLFRSLGETTAADAAISVKTLETCPHHPHGCPKECLCPKTLTRLGEAGVRTENPGTLNEPSWVTCTEKGPQSLSSAFALFIVEPACTLTIPEAGGFARADGTPFIPETSPKPPQKIPIV